MKTMLGKLSIKCAFAAFLFSLMQSTLAVASSYEEDLFLRKQLLLTTYATGGSPGLENELARLAVGQDVNESGITPTLAYIDSRQDKSDFNTPGLLWIMHKYQDSPHISQTLTNQIKQTLLNFKYWPDEPGPDTMCSWTENHEILFMTSAYLAGQLWPDETFTNSGWTGQEQMARHHPRIMRWLDLRFHTGFWEWLSNVYYEEDLLCMVTLAEFAQDREIAVRAKMVADLLCLDMALNSFKGTFGSTHGRSYGQNTKRGSGDRTKQAQWLLFGNGSMGNSSSSLAMALSEKYEPAEVIAKIANDDATMENRQRMGIRVEDGPRWGIGYESLEDGMTWMCMGAYGHPLTAHLFLQMMTAYNWWVEPQFSFFADYRELLELMDQNGTLGSFTQSLIYDTTRVVLEEANIYTYRTADYMLSSAPDYRPGYGGGQQYIWQATLGPEAVCFTNHPGSYNGDEPGYWTGNGWVPRVDQHQNVAIIVYNAVDLSAIYLPASLPFTHAWLPKDKFDEVIELNEPSKHWVFARKGDAYLALFTQNPYYWQSNSGEDQNRELVVSGRQNIYVCELGRQSDNGSFANFVDAISNAPITCNGLSVSYQSPSQGLLQFEWVSEFDSPKQAKIANPFPRYDNPYVHASFGSETVLVQHGESTLWLNWSALARFTDSPPGMPVGGVLPLAATAIGLFAVGFRRLQKIARG